MMSVELTAVDVYAYCVGMPHHVQLQEAGIDGSQRTSATHTLRELSAKAVQFRSHKRSTEHLQEP
jgi:hypothetical protein